jgi:hypothetical protein
MKRRAFITLLAARGKCAAGGGANGRNSSTLYRLVAFRLRQS